jgi:chromosome segregation ATPase
MGDTEVVMHDQRAHERITKVEVELNNHQTQLTRLETAMASNTASLEENTRLTREIARNTGDLVELIKGFKGFRRLVVWLAPIIAGALALWEYFQLHWK